MGDTVRFRQLGKWWSRKAQALIELTTLTNPKAGEASLLKGLQIQGVKIPANEEVRFETVLEITTCESRATTILQAVLNVFQDWPDYNGVIVVVFRSGLFCRQTILFARWESLYPDRPVPQAILAARQCC